MKTEQLPQAAVMAGNAMQLAARGAYDAAQAYALAAIALALVEIARVLAEAKDA